MNSNLNEVLLLSSDENVFDVEVILQFKTFIQILVCIVLFLFDLTDISQGTEPIESHKNKRSYGKSISNILSHNVIYIIITFLKSLSDNIMIFLLNNQSHG